MARTYRKTREEAIEKASPTSKSIYYLDETGKRKSEQNPLFSGLNSPQTSKNPASSSETLPVSIVVERAEQDQIERKPLKNEKQYRDFLLQSLGVTSLLLALLICWVATLPTFLAEELALTPEEVEAFAGPGARLMAKSKIPEGVKNSLVNSGDYIGLGTAALMYIYRVLDTMKSFKEHTINGSTGQAEGISTSNHTTTGGNNGYATATGVHAGQLAGWGNFTAG